MARDVRDVWILQGTLEAVTGLHVGGAGSDASVDLALARDGRGRVLIPGTSLAGVLRAMYARHADAGEVNRLFGFQGKAGTASWIRVADAPVDGHVEVRDGVALDRYTGAAAHDFLFTRQIIATGATLPLELVLELDAGRAEELEGVVPAFAATLLERGLTVGAGSSRGLGRLALNDLQIRRVQLDRRPHLAAWWSHRAGHDVDWPDDTRVAPAAAWASDTWVFEIRWRPRGPIMVKAGRDGAHFDQVPLTTRDREGRHAAVLPGSAVKGALRSVAERICRTLAGAHLRPTEDPKQHIRFTSIGEMTEVADLFGRSRGEEHEPARAALSVPDCHHQARFDVDLAELTPQSADMPPGVRYRTRIAVDRWTGGPVDGALFTHVVPPWEDGEPGWEALRLEIDLCRLPEDPGDRRPRCLALAWLLVEHLRAGEIPLGFGTHRGFGAVQVDSVRVAGPGIAEATLRGAETPPVALQEHVTRWEAAWKRAWS